MPIEAINSLLTPLSGALQPRPNATPSAPDAGIDALQGMAKSTGESDSVSTGPTFGQILQNAIGEVNSSQLHAGDMAKRFAAGEPIDVHQVMIAAQEASVSLNLAIQVRNKLVDGYQELMRVSV